MKSLLLKVEGGNVMAQLKQGIRHLNRSQDIEIKRWHPPQDVAQKGEL